MIRVAVRSGNLKRTLLSCCNLLQYQGVSIPARSRDVYGGSAVPSLITRFFSLSAILRDSNETSEPPLPAYVARKGEALEVKRARLLYQSRLRSACLFFCPRWPCSLNNSVKNCQMITLSTLLNSSCSCMPCVVFESYYNSMDHTRLCKLHSYIATHT